MENNKNETPEQPDKANRPERKINTGYKDKQPYPKDPGENYDLPHKPKPEIGDNDGDINTPFDKNNDADNNHDSNADEQQKLPETDERGNNRNETM
jgi:hypothetical protein